MNRQKNQREPGDYDRLMLASLNTLENVYGGTVDPALVAKRRAKNKLARASRSANRRWARAHRVGRY